MPGTGGGGDGRRVGKGARAEGWVAGGRSTRARFSVRAGQPALRPCCRRGRWLEEPPCAALCSGRGAQLVLSVADRVGRAAAADVLSKQQLCCGRLPLLHASTRSAVLSEPCLSAPHPACGGHGLIRLASLGGVAAAQLPAHNRATRLDLLRHFLHGVSSSLLPEEAGAGGCAGGCRSRSSRRCRRGLPLLGTAAWRRCDFAFRPINFPASSDCVAISADLPHLLHVPRGPAHDGARRGVAVPTDARQALGRPPGPARRHAHPRRPGGRTVEAVRSCWRQSAAVQLACTCLVACGQPPPRFRLRPRNPRTPPSPVAAVV